MRPVSLPVQDIVFQLQRLVNGMSKYHNECHKVLNDAIVFPIEVDLSRSTFTYDTSNQFDDNDDEEEEEEEEEEGETGEQDDEILGEPETEGGFSGDLISTD